MYPQNHRKRWRFIEIMRLRWHASKGRTAREIAHRLGRTEEAVVSKAAELRVSLRPERS